MRNGGVRTFLRSSALVATVLALAGPAGAQRVQRYAPAALSVEDYARAERFMGYNVNPLVYGAGVIPTWLADGRLGYRVHTARGNEFVLVDPERGTREPAFDQHRLAAALSQASGKAYAAFDLPFRRFELAYNGATILFSIADRQWSCDLGTYRCAPGTGRDAVDRRREVASPDGARAAFIRDHNLWVRELATGQERPLTRDGIEDYGYGTDNAGWRRSDRPVLVWSPDSRRIATFQQDQRGVGEMFLADTRVGHPRLSAWKYPLPGDSVVTMIERVVIDIDTGDVVRLQIPPDQHRSSLCDDVACRGVWGDVQWNPDSTSLAFVSTSRDHQRESLRIAEAETGQVHTVLQESVSTFFESGIGGVNWRYLPGFGEAIWFSERDGWGHLYLYDLASGELERQITSGVGNVARVLRVDEERRQIYFLGVGMESGRDPYFQHLYRVGFDGSGLTLLTPEDANHAVSMSESGSYFVDSYSRPDVPPITVLRAANGDEILELEKADITALLATRWQPPVPITVKGRDGETDLYGLMYKPTWMDESRKYPIVNSVYPGPQAGSVGSRNFSAARGDAQALAELGFIVVKIDGMGTPGRSKSFHETYYGDMGDNTLPDQVTGMRQLAERYPWIDIERAGIYGHSGGGFASAAAMFHYPEFFKVGVSEAGNHDNRVYEDDWGEKWQGLLRRDPDRGTNYDAQANQNFAGNLQGKLLLAHGTMDTNVPVYNTLLVVDALIAANKDFDLLLLPNRNHGFGNEPYMVRRRWDYFVENLLGAKPPSQYLMGQDRPQ